MAAALDGKSLDVRLDGTPLALRLSATGRPGAGRPGRRATGVAAATLAGSPLAMIRLLGGDPQALIREGDVRITGDTDIANQFRDLLHMARPDLEEELSKLVGDPVAHQVGNLARGFADWGERAAESVSRSVGEYLTEERRTLAHPRGGGGVLPGRRPGGERRGAGRSPPQPPERPAVTTCRSGFSRDPGRESTVAAEAAPTP